MPDKQTYAIFSAQYAPHTGGVESFTQRLASQLLSEGHRVIVVTSKLAPDHEARETIDGVEVRRLPCHSLMGGRLPIANHDRIHRFMMGELAEEGITRVLVNTRFYFHSLDGVQFASDNGIPVVVLDHGSAHLTMGGGIIDKCVEAYEHHMTKKVKKLSPKFAGISNASARWLAHFGIYTDKVIPNAIDVSEFQAVASDRDFREELGLSDNDKLVAFVGRLEPEKGAMPFARAGEFLEDGYVLALAGDGRLKGDIEALNLPNVKLLGRLGQEDLSAFLGDADVFVLPTRSEGFCTSLLEASAQGLVSVMPRVGGTDEVIGYPGERGMILESCSSEDVARGIIEACEMAKSGLGQSVCDHVDRNCSWTATSAALDAAFEE